MGKLLFKNDRNALWQHVYARSVQVHAFLCGTAMVFDKFWVHDAIAIDLYDVICRSSRNGFIEDFRLSETVIFLPKMFNRNLAGFLEFGNQLFGFFFRAIVGNQDFIR